jgi:hypothetical protein
MKRLIVFLLCTALCCFQQDTRAAGWLPLAKSSGGASVALDSCGALQDYGSAGTSQTYTLLTVGTGSNRALVVGTYYFDNTITAPAVHWDSSGTNQAMTSIANLGTSGGGVRIELWGLIAPTSGNKTLTVTWTTTGNVAVVACSWTGVNATFGTAFTGHTAVDNSNTAATITNTITSSSTHQVMAIESNDGSSGTASSVNQTSLGLISSFTNIAGNMAAGAASVSMTYTNSTSTSRLVSVGVDISP